MPHVRLGPEDPEKNKSGMKGPTLPDHVLAAIEAERRKERDEEVGGNESNYDDPKSRKRKDRGGRKRKADDDDDPDNPEGDYSSEGVDSKYATWMPPQGQTGDGRTSLNDKLGY